jgi:hypothetical protein
MVEGSRSTAFDAGVRRGMDHVAISTQPTAVSKAAAPFSPIAFTIYRTTSP